MHLSFCTSVFYCQTAQDISVANVQMFFESLSVRGGHTHILKLAKDRMDDAAETHPKPDPSKSCDETQDPEEKQDHTSHHLGNNQILLKVITQISLLHFGYHCVCV